MGRPINKRNFGNPSNPGNQIVVMADLGFGPTSAWIKKQKGTKRFVVTDGTNEKICDLVQTITNPGQATIDVIKISGPNEKARTVLSKRVKTWEGSNYAWKFNTPTSAYVKIDNS